MRTHTQKDFQHDWSSGKIKLKSQQNTTTHPLERLKLKRLKIPNVGKDVK